ncbi:hypothetical protein [Fimbriiglobus ruber]|uniref:Carboxypeptidase regulatory-like domain-containing protein n=1 Tax=Fimbriiglobus ruber TaxID=1908690 RepID=A0A225E181_9BACT|nr:hypothetical protein [Fimbriiglobus ruber]OWK43776.1 hypothetical protein FRUB_03375 [Fimbriiglobus ruber]
MLTNLKSRSRLGAAIALGLCLAVMLGGCGGQPKAQVAGTVTLDGKPLQDGVISFYPEAGVGPSAGTGIKDGKYTMETPVAKMKVVINATEVIGKRKKYDTPDSPVTEDVRELLPAEYNTKSKLTATLQPGPNTVDFDLKSAAKK